MFKMFKQLFSAVTYFFIALESAGKSVANIAKIGEEKSEQYVSTARLERQAELKSKLKELGITQKQYDELVAKDVAKSEA